MKDIFAPSPQFKQTQYRKLSDNVNEWESEIHDIISNVVPKELGLSTTLHWQKVNDQEGYAIGSIVLAPKGNDVSIGIPIIIKSWHLAPLDTFLIDDKAYPLTENGINEVFSSNALGSDIIPRTGPYQAFDPGHQSDHVMPPLGGGRYVYSSDQTSLLNKILPTAWKTDIDEFRKTAKEEGILTAAAEHGHYRTFRKIAQQEGKAPNGKSSLKRPIIQIRKQSVNEYSILGNPEGVFDPLIHNVDRPTMEQFVGSVSDSEQTALDTVSKIDKNLEYTIAPPKRQELGPQKVGRKLGEHGEVMLFDTKGPIDDKAQQCDKFGVYGIRDSAGVQSFGYVFPNVISFDNKKMGIKIFVGKNASSVQSRFAGVPDPDREVQLPKTEPDPGKIGTLIYEKDGNAVATEPFRIITSKAFQGMRGITVKDYQGNNATLCFTPNIGGITKITESKELGPLVNGPVYCCPADMKFVELGETKKLPESPDEHSKSASLSTSAVPLKVTRVNGRYIFSGPDMPKYASAGTINFDMDSLHEHDAKFLLASFGCPMSKIATVLHPPNEQRSVYVSGLTMPKLASSETSSVETKKNEFIRRLRVNLIKEASTMENAEAVDAVLSLGFINPENIGRFIESIPRLKETMSIISKLLLGSRLGLENIPEDACTSSIQHLAKIVDGLNKLSLMK